MLIGAHRKILESAPIRGTLQEALKLRVFQQPLTLSPPPPKGGTKVMITFNTPFKKTQYEEAKKKLGQAISYQFVKLLLKKYPTILIKLICHRFYHHDSSRNMEMNSISLLGEWNCPCHQRNSHMLTR